MKFLSVKEQALDEELRFHIEASVEKKVAAGMSEEVARKEALREFGGLDLAKEEIRDGWARRSFFGFFRDLGLGCRQLWAHKFSAFVIALTLGLAVGCNTAIFSTLNELAIKGLPFRDSDRIVEVYNSYGQDERNNEGNSLSNYLLYSERKDLFESVSLRQPLWVTASWEGKMIRSQKHETTVEYFETLGVQPLLGDFFQADDRKEGSRRVTVLSYSFWQTHFGGQPGVVGRSLKVGEELHEIIGVAPRSVSSLDTTVGFFTPLRWQEGNVDTDSTIPRHVYSGQLWARLAEGVSVAVARERLNAINATYFAELLAEDKAMLQRMGHRIGIDTVKNERIRDVKGSLVMLQIAAGLILLIASVNVSNILLARANERQAEFGIRAALGAGRAMLLRQVSAELVLVATLACVVGIFTGALGIQLINTKATGLLPPIEGVRLDGVVLLGTVGFSVLAVFVCGAFSSWRVWQTNLSDSLKSGGRSASAGKFARRTSAWLVSGQCAVAFAVTVGAGLLWMSLHRAINMDPGFASRNVATLRLHFSWDAYPERWQLPDFQRRLSSRLEANPEIENFAYSTNVPSFGYNRSLVHFPDRVFEKSLEQARADMSIVSPGYFETVGIELLDGRDFEPTDIERESEPMIVDERFAEEYFGRESPLGRKIHLGGLPGEGEQWATIVGVVESARNLSLDNAEDVPFVYRVLRPRRSREYSLFIKTRTPPEGVLERVSAEVRELDPDLAPFRMGKLDMFLDEALTNRKAILAMIGVFAALALGLSALGIYAALAHDVSQRKKELSIRSALGARGRELFKAVVLTGLRRVGIGMALGLVAALLLSRLLSGMLFAVEATEPAVYLGIGVVMLLVGLVASIIPGLSAMRIRALDSVRMD